MWLSRWQLTRGEAFEIRLHVGAVLDSMIHEMNLANSDTLVKPSRIQQLQKLEHLINNIMFELLYVTKELSQNPKDHVNVWSIWSNKAKHNVKWLVGCWASLGHNFTFKYQCNRIEWGSIHIIGSSLLNSNQSNPIQSNISRNPIHDPIRFHWLDAWRRFVLSCVILWLCAMKLRCYADSQES